MNSKILIVEDEAKLREVLCDYFSSKGELPVEASNGMQALELIDENEFDAVLLDIMMPELDGLSVCRAVRRTNDVPIIFLTALSDEDDKLLGYELGADDYITKPFDTAELLARIAVQLRKAGSNLSDRIIVGDLQLDLNAHTLRVKNSEIRLTKTEFAILKLLMQNPGQVITKSVMLDRISLDTQDCTESSLKQHVSNLRRKLRDVGGEDTIESVWGIGFRLAEKF